MIQADVEPDRRIERAVLVQAQPGQFIVKNFRSFRIREVAVRQSPVGNRARDAVNQLPHRSFSSALIWIGAVRDVAVKIFRDSYFGRQRAPAFRDFDVLLLKDDFATVIGDFGGAPFPFNLIKWGNSGIAEHALKTQAGLFLFVGLVSSAHSRFTWSFKRGGRNSGF